MFAVNGCIFKGGNSSNILIPFWKGDLISRIDLHRKVNWKSQKLPPSHLVQMGQSVPSVSSPLYKSKVPPFEKKVRNEDARTVNGLKGCKQSLTLTTSMPMIVYNHFLLYLANWKSLKTWDSRRPTGGWISLDVSSVKILILILILPAPLDDVIVYKTSIMHSVWA